MRAVSCCGAGAWPDFLEKRGTSTAALPAQVDHKSCLWRPSAAAAACTLLELEAQGRGAGGDHGQPSQRTALIACQRTRQTKSIHRLPRQMSESAYVHGDLGAVGVGLCLADASLGCMQKCSAECKGLGALGLALQQPSSEALAIQSPPKLLGSSHLNWLDLAELPMVAEAADTPPQSGCVKSQG